MCNPTDKCHEVNNLKSVFSARRCRRKETGVQNRGWAVRRHARKGKEEK